MSTKSSKFKTVAKNLIWLVLLLGPFAWIMFNLRMVSDEVLAWRFTPDPEVAEHQSDLKLTRSAGVVFEASRPQLSPASTLLTVCADHSSSIVLGCYSNGEIYTYDVESEELDGIVQATFAHELLHAVYARLSDKEKQEITAQLFDYYENKGSDLLKQQIAAYGNASREVIGNELHSIVPIVEADLPEELEQHYAQYFKDLGLVQSYFAGYWSKFEALNQQVSSIDGQIELAGADLDTTQSRLNRYKSDIKNYASQADQLSSQIDNAQPENVNQLIDQYNVIANNYQRSVSEHNQVVIQHNELVKKYNQLLADRSTAADDLSGLYEAIDPRDSAQSVESEA